MRYAFHWRFVFWLNSSYNNERELNKKYEVLLIILFLVFLLFLFSEGLLFVSFFWTTFHSFSFPTLEIWPGEGFYVPDPCELTFRSDREKEMRMKIFDVVVELWLSLNVLSFKPAWRPGQQQNSLVLVIRK